VGGANLGTVAVAVAIPADLSSFTMATTTGHRVNLALG